MKNSLNIKKGNISAQKAVEILRGHGTLVTVEEAEKILHLLNLLAKLALDQYVKKENL